MGYLSELLEAAGELGGPVNEAFEPMREHLRRAGALAEGLDSARRAGERAYGELVKALSEGRTPPDGVPAAVAEASLWAYDSLAARAVDQAAAGARRLAESAARDAGPRAFEILRERVAAIVQESVELAATLPATVTTDALMIKHGDPAAAASWLSLRRLIGAWDRAHGMAWIVQVRCQLLGPVDENDWGVENAGPFLKFAAPDRLPRGYAAMAPELKLARAAAAGAGPGLVPITLAAARARAAGPAAGRVHAMSTETMFASAREAALALPVLEASAAAAVPGPPMPS